MNFILKELIDVLHDPQLPFAEISNILSSLSGRLPPKLEDSIQIQWMRLGLKALTLNSQQPA
jgi:hypothetical protein